MSERFRRNRKLKNLRVDTEAKMAEAPAQRQPQHRRVRVHTDSVVAVVEVVETRAVSHPKVVMVATVSSSFALRALTTTIGRSPHGSMLQVFKAAPSSAPTMIMVRPQISDGRSEFDLLQVISIQR